MGLIAKLWQLLSLKVISASVQAQVDQTRQELETEETKLRDLLLKKLKLKRGDLDFRLRPSPNGFLVPKIEFFVDVTPKQMAAAQQFLDQITLSRQNVRTPPGVH